MEFTNSAQNKTKARSLPPYRWPNKKAQCPVAQLLPATPPGPCHARRTAEHGRRTRRRDIARYFSPNPSG